MTKPNHFSDGNALKRQRSRRTGGLIAIGCGIASVILVLVVASLLGVNASQRKTIAALDSIGQSAMQRLGTWQTAPAYSFENSSSFLMKLTDDPTYYGTVIRVGFNKYDEKQLFESIPHLRALPKLKQIGFHSVPDQSMLARMRDALPDVSFYGPNGKIQ